MADQNYGIDTLAPGTATVTMSDDGSGNDWLSFAGVYTKPTDINLNWAYVGAADGLPTSASGFFYTFDTTLLAYVGHRLVVNGQIEHAQGSLGDDFIQGNSLANAIYGDHFQTGPGGDDTLYGSDGNDSILGGTGDDEIDGAEDDDYLLGNSGDDTISGGGGNDVIEGGEGADSMSGGASGQDEVSYFDSSAGVRISITYGSTTTGVGGYAAGDRLNGFNNVAGSVHGDTITDTVAATIAFGYNANTFYGNDGNDTLNLGGGNDIGYGGNGLDTLKGGVGRDKLFGGAGADVLKGGADVDILRGDKGADDFVFSKISDSGKTSTTRDTISDFKHLQGDDIDLRGIDAKSSTHNVNDAFKFIADNAFSHTAGEVQFVDSGANLLVRGDVNGDGRADFSILVLNVAKLVAGDFLL